MKVKIIAWLWHIITLGYHKKFNDLLQVTDKAVSDIERYKSKPLLIGVDAFEKDDKGYQFEVAAILDKPEFKFFMFDLREQVLDKMAQGDGDANTQCIGMLKGFDLILRNMLSIKQLTLKDGENV